MPSRRRRRRDNFSVARFFLKLVTLAKWGRRERIGMLEWLGEEKRRRNNCAWIIFQRVSMIESNDSSILDSLKSLSTSLLYRFQVSEYYYYCSAVRAQLLHQHPLSLLIWFCLVLFFCLCSVLIFFTCLRYLTAWQKNSSSELGPLYTAFVP